MINRNKDLILQINILIFMAFLQKVSFCNFICNNPWLFSACRRKKIVIAVASFIYKILYIKIINLFLALKIKILSKNFNDSDRFFL